MRSERLFFRKFTRNDFGDYYRLVGSLAVMKWITGKARTEEEAQFIFDEVLKSNHEKGDTGYFAIFQQRNDQYIGLGKIVPKSNQELEIGYALLPEFWGKGFGSEISKFLVQKANSISNIREIIAIIDPENLASKKILLKCDFRLDHRCMIEDLPAEIYKISRNNDKNIEDR